MTNPAIIGLGHLDFTVTDGDRALYSLKVVTIGPFLSSPSGFVRAQPAKTSREPTVPRLFLMRSTNHQRPSRRSHRSW
jgi:hypothetical protein